MSNTLRMTFLMIAGIILLGMMISSIILWIPIIGLTFAGITGICPMMKAAGIVLDKMDIER